MIDLIRDLDAFVGGELARILSSVCVILLAFVLNRLNIRYRTKAAERSRERIEQNRQQMVLIKNAILLSALAIIIVIWASKIAGVAISLSAFAVALVISTKELLMCLTGYGLYAMSRPFHVGDHVEVMGVQGLVTDVDLLSFTLSETNASYQVIGRTTTLPNSMLLTAPVTNNLGMGAYVFEDLRIAVPYDVDREACAQAAITAGSEVTKEWDEAARLHLELLSSRSLLRSPSSKTRVIWEPVDTKQHWLVVRFITPVARREKTAQEILRLFWEKFGSELITPAQRSA